MLVRDVETVKDEVPTAGQSAHLDPVVDVSDRYIEIFVLSEEQVGPLCAAHQDGDLGSSFKECLDMAVAEGPGGTEDEMVFGSGLSSS